MGKITIQCRVMPGMTVVPDSQQRVPLTADDIKRLSVPSVSFELDSPYPAALIGTTTEIENADAVEGALAYDTDVKRLKVFDGTDWVIPLNPGAFVGTTEEVAALETAPGVLAYDTTLSQLKIYTGSAWVTLLSVT